MWLVELVRHTFKTGKLPELLVFLEIVLIFNVDGKFSA